jgi:hypothetical protein
MCLLCCFLAVTLLLSAAIAELRASLALQVKEVLLSGGTMEKAAEQLRGLESEVALLRNLSHPNIVRYLGTERTPQARHCAAPRAGERASGCRAQRGRPGAHVAAHPARGCLRALARRAAGRGPHLRKHATVLGFERPPPCDGATRARVRVTPARTSRARQRRRAHAARTSVNRVPLSHAPLTRACAAVTCGRRLAGVCMPKHLWPCMHAGASHLPRVCARRQHRQPAEQVRAVR